MEFVVAGYLRRLVLSVKLTGPQGAQIFGQASFWVLPWGCLGMRVALKLMAEESRLPCLIWAGLTAP